MADIELLQANTQLKNYCPPDNGHLVYELRSRWFLRIHVLYGGIIFVSSGGFKHILLYLSHGYAKQGMEPMLN